MTPTDRPASDGAIVLSLYSRTQKVLTVVLPVMWLVFAVVLLTLTEGAERWWTALGLAGALALLVYGAIGERNEAIVIDGDRIARRKGVRARHVGWTDMSDVIEANITVRKHYPAGYMNVLLWTRRGGTEPGGEKQILPPDMKQKMLANRQQGINVFTVPIGSMNASDREVMVDFLNRHGVDSPSLTKAK